jgi:hypothetical protein
MHHGLPVRKSVTSENPRSGSGPSVSARPEGEQTVEGVRNPEDGRCRARYARVVRIPPLMSLKGRETPGGATRSRQDRGGRFGQNPERETKPVGAAGRSSDRTDGRTAEHLAVVETTWRRRRTKIVATPCGALREAGQPCEGRPQDGDVPWNSRDAAETPGGATRSWQDGGGGFGQNPVR